MRGLCEPYSEAANLELSHAHAAASKVRYGLSTHSWGLSKKHNQWFFVFIYKLVRFTHLANITSKSLAVLCPLSHLAVAYTELVNINTYKSIISFFEDLSFVKMLRQLAFFLACAIQAGAAPFLARHAVKGTNTHVLASVSTGHILS